MRQPRPTPAPEASAQAASEETPEPLSVDDTILVLSQTTLLRMAEFGRPSKRPTGLLHLGTDEKKDE